MHAAKAAQGGGLPIQPAGLSAEHQHAGVVLDGLLVLALALVDVGEAELGGGLGTQVTVGLRGGQAGLGDGKPVNGVGAKHEVSA
jgi:hypothetical protein